MEREPTRFLKSLTDLNPKHQEKLTNLTSAVFNLLWTNLHKVDTFHREFTINTLGDSIYKFAPRIKSGFISVEANKALAEGKVVRSRLCHEHPKTRKATALELINTVDYHIMLGSSNTDIKEDLSSVLYSGSRVNLVLSEENIRLFPFQQMGLDADECYELAGIELMPDILEEREYSYKGKVYTTQQEIARDLNISRTTVQRYLKQGIITVERKN